ncbi:GNAT family N-acetyltransferase [Fictibacillus enclensis]|uniref:GNAT family N-acetyltransferase n=1 Tax=Fictibacillus enclensis TaxID=1017270 RepID=UPI0025A0E3EF|nr:GNAT family N-acetyltransferase [Fictibacillus enclensis]MDM5196532.1 GNAT family N-acetyltransferase [Fictibacillus enclensis]
MLSFRKSIVLHKGENIRDFTANPNAMVIRALSINHSEQGKGYAKVAMIQVPQFISVHFSEINEIILAVNFKNEPAKKLYEKEGFLDRGTWTGWTSICAAPRYINLIVLFSDNRLINSKVDEIRGDFSVFLV